MRKNIKKKVMSFLLVCVMVLALCACGKNDGNSNVQKSVADTEEVTETIDSTENDDKTETEAAVQSSDAKVEEKDDTTVEEEKEIAEEKAPLGPDEIYAQVLDGYYADLVSEFPIDNYFPMTLGTFETTIMCASDEVLKNVGYAKMDINGDGTQELLIVEVSNQGQTAYHGERILAMYTIANDEAHFLAGGWARNRYYLLNDGRIFNEGSSGANDSSYDIYSLVENSYMLEMIDSENSNSADYEKHLEELGKLIETVQIETFAEYETTKDYPNSAKTFWSAVYVNPAETTFASTGSDSYTASTSEYARELVFFTPSEVTDFKFNSLTPGDTKDGETVFEEEELYSLDRLVMDKAVTITMEFAGDIPNYGISYTDAGGNVRKYAIGESGFDGSIYLSRY